MQEETLSRQGAEPAATRRRRPPSELVVTVVPIVSAVVAGVLATFLPTQVALSILFTLVFILAAGALALARARTPNVKIAMEAPIAIPVRSPSLARQVLLARARPIQPSHLDLTPEERDDFDAALAEARA